MVIISFRALQENPVITCDHIICLYGVSMLNYMILDTHIYPTLYLNKSSEKLQISSCTTCKLFHTFFERIIREITNIMTYPNRSKPTGSADYDVVGILPMFSPQAPS